MCVDTGKDRVETEVHILFVNDVLSRHLVLVALALSEINHEDEGRVCTQAHHEVVWIDVPVNKSVTVQHL